MQDFYRTIVNPFQPFSPVSPENFVGRIHEIKRIKAQLVQTRAGKPTNFMILGERGIGKTSLMNYVQLLATGKIQNVASDLNFLVIHTDIDKQTTQLGFIKRIERILKRELGKSEQTRKFLSDVWSFTQRIESTWGKLNPESDSDLHEMASEEFAYSLAKTCDRVCKKNKKHHIFDASYDGVLMLIDEADKCSNELALGSFLKLLTERLKRQMCNCFMIGIAGLPSLRHEMIKSHESSVRIFEEIEIERLNNQEINTVITTFLTEAMQQNEVQITIKQDARELLIKFSEGYPHFIQQFGYCAFEADEDNMIDLTDCRKGASRAIELIGNHYYRDNFYNRIQNENYRQVLRIMADQNDLWISKDKIRSMFGEGDSVLDNAIRALRERHMIVSKEGQRGIYRLQHRGFAYWIKIKTVGHSSFDERQDQNQIHPYDDPNLRPI